MEMDEWPVLRSDIDAVGGSVGQAVGGMSVDEADVGVDDEADEADEDDAIDDGLVVSLGFRSVFPLPCVM